MIMQNFWGVEEVYYGIVQVVNPGITPLKYAYVMITDANSIITSD